MSIKRVLTVLIIQTKQFMRDKAAVFWVILFPVILILLFGFIFQGEEESTYTLPVQNQDGGPFSTILIKNLNNTGVFDIKIVEPSIDPKKYMKEHDQNIVLVIPQGYSQNISRLLSSPNKNSSLNPVNLTVIYDPSVSTTGVKIGIINSVIDSMNMHLSGGVHYMGLTAVSTVSNKFKFIDFFTPGIIVMGVMTSSLFSTVGVNTEYKQKGILKKLSTTPIKSSEWLLGIILYQLLTATIATVVILMVSVFVFNLKASYNLFLPLFVILDVFTFSGIGMIISRFVKEAQSAEAAANAVMFPMMFLSGIFFPLEMMPDFLQKIALFMPLYYLGEGLRDGMIYSLYYDALLNAAIVGVFSILVFVIGVLITRLRGD